MSGGDVVGLAVGAVVRLKALDDLPSHLFEVQSVEADCVTGLALCGPSKGEYGEPDLSMIVEVCWP